MAKTRNSLAASSEEIQRMRELRKQGLRPPAIGRVVGRSPACAWVHTRDVVPRKEPNPSSFDRAMRMERLFASCNRVLAEVRA